MIAAAAAAAAGRRWWDEGRRKALAHQFSHYHHILSLYVGKLGDPLVAMKTGVYLGFPLSRVSKSHRPHAAPVIHVGRLFMPVPTWSTLQAPRLSGMHSH